MDSVFNIIPNNFFNPLSSNSNYRINSVLLQFIYEQYGNEISYRIQRNILRDEMAYFISNNSDFFVSDSETASKSYQEMASDYLRKFAGKDVGWLEEEFDESTFEKYIVITEQGVLLAELLIRLEKPEREELSSYMYNIYNTILNQDQWNGDPYVGALKNILIDKTGIPFHSLYMSIGELQQYEKYWKPLKKNDIVKAKSLINIHFFEDVIDFMLQNNCKLEQEIISWLYYGKNH